MGMEMLFEKMTFLSESLFLAIKYYQESYGMTQNLELAIEIEARKLRTIFLKNLVSFIKRERI